MSVSSDDHIDGGGENEFAEGLGNGALIFLSIGGLYVILRRLYQWSRNWNEEKKTEQAQMIEFYRRLRKPLLLIHNWTTIFAVLFAGIHGFLYLGEELEHVVTGFIALGVMILLSTFGMMIYFKFKPVWENRETRGFIRFVHRQWILSVILVITLIIHTA